MSTSKAQDTQFSRSQPTKTVVNVCSNPFQWLIDFARAECLSVIPSADGEPWLPYQAIALLTQETERTISDKAQKFGLPKHPAFPGHVKFTDFERCAAERQPTDGKRGK